MHIFKRPIVQFVLFQIQWWACILFAHYDHPNIGAVIAITICLVEYWQLKFRMNELKMILLYAYLGIFMDSILSYFQVMVYKYYTPGVNWVIPLWGLALWLSFATWLQIAFYLKNYQVWLSLATLFIAPASYFAGVRLSVMALEFDHVSLLLIGLCWVIYMNLVIYLQRFQNVTKPIP